MEIKTIRVLKKAINNFITDDISEKVAALSYYTILSLPGMALIFLIILEYFLSESAISRLESIVSRYIGAEVSDLLLELLYNLYEMEREGLFGFLGIIFLIYSSVNSFRQMERTFDIIWKIQSNDKKIVSSILSRISNILLLFSCIILIFSLGILMGIINNLLKNYVLYELVIYSTF